MKIASALLLALLAAPKPAVPVRKSAGFGIPRLAPSQLWVTSIPVGLEVRLGEDPKAKAVGRTPLVLKASEATRYVTVTLRKSEAAGNLPTSPTSLPLGRTAPPTKTNAPGRSTTWTVR